MFEKKIMVKSLLFIGAGAGVGAGKKKSRCRSKTDRPRNTGSVRGSNSLDRSNKKAKGTSGSKCVEFRYYEGVLGATFVC